MGGLQSSRIRNKYSKISSKFRNTWVSVWKARKVSSLVKLEEHRASLYTTSHLLITWLFMPFWLPFIVAENLEVLDKTKAKSTFIKYLILNSFIFAIAAYCFINTVRSYCMAAVVLFWGINFIILRMYKARYAVASRRYSERTVKSFLGVLALGVVFGILELVSFAILVSIILQFL